MADRYRIAVDTRRFYAFENAYPWPEMLVRRRYWRELEATARWLYASYSVMHPIDPAPGHNAQPPQVYVGTRGIRYNGSSVSYCDWDNRIYLVAEDCNFQVLIHKLAHAVGPVHHGPDFVDAYLELMGIACGDDFKDELYLQMLMHNIRM